VRTRLMGVALFGVVVASLAACDPATEPSGSSKPSSVPSGSVVPPATATADGKQAGGGKVATVPDFVGMGLQSAQDKAQEVGFYGLKSHDSLGRDRMQVFDRNWKVCFQNVKAGTSVKTDTEVDFGAVKLEESCPSKDETAPSAAGGKMPDFTGKSVKAARAALDSGTSITVNDASGDGRWVLVESNWQVCTQTPAPGTALNGRPVTFTAVKFGESCP
jgi:beta-lactam-binding protein with PASTA domain